MNSESLVSTRLAQLFSDNVNLTKKMGGPIYLAIRTKANVVASATDKDNVDMFMSVSLNSSMKFKVNVINGISYSGKKEITDTEATAILQEIFNRGVK